MGHQLECFKALLQFAEKTHYSLVDAIGLQCDHDYTPTEIIQARKTIIEMESKSSPPTDS